MIKKLILSIITVILPLSFLLAQSAKTAKAWNDLSVFQAHKVDPHVNVVPYTSKSSLAHLDFRHSPYYRCLNGEWDFFFVESPSEAPNGLVVSSLERDYRLSHKPAKIQVPGNWEMQGFGIPVYVNVANEFPSNPPFAPEKYNPVGCYVRDFELPEGWSGRRTFLHIGAVKSCCYLFVNGSEVGYSEDSKTAAEWDITKYLQPGRNRICLKVYRFCDGSYLECQDMWRVSGITRDVFLYSTPRVHIKDFKILSDLDTVTYSRGLLDLAVYYSQQVGRTLSLEAELLDAQGNRVASKRKTVEPSEWFTFFSPRDFNLPDVRPWTPDDPYLYTLSLALYDGGQIVHLTGAKVGFRTLEMKNVGSIQQFCLNGQPLTIRGVNRHEHSGINGQYVTPSEMRKDIALMKECNVNAVRTSHYPCDELWYDLCDSAGIMVWAEANVESHAQGYGENSLAKKSEWTAPIVYRCNNMYQRDKNHPSIIVWSLGNECGNGICMEQAYRFMKKKDQSRPVAYERTEHDWNTDIIGIMYPSVDYLSAYANGRCQDEFNCRRPYIMVEYAHAMGNSVGGLSDYWDTINRYPVLQGGFIWDWVDQSFVMHDSLGRKWYAVGGDLGSLEGVGNDDAFCANGLVTSDRIPHAHFYQVKAVYGAHRSPVILHPPQPSRRVLSDSYPIPQPNKVRTTKKGNIITLSSEHFSMAIDASNGSIRSYRYKGKEYLERPLRFNFWRPPTLNDLVDRNGARAWKGLDQLQCRIISTHTLTNDDPSNPAAAEVKLTMGLQNADGQQIHLHEIIQVDAQGRAQISFLTMPNGNFRTLPKMGIQMGLDTTFAHVQWLGNPNETYPDRYWGSDTLSNVRPSADLVGEMHLVPQESGNREAWTLSFQSPDRKLDITANNIQGLSERFNFTLRRYEDSTLTQATRIHQLPSPVPYYVVSIDHQQSGIGTATCGPGVRSLYTLSGDSLYGYSFTLVPSLPEEPTDVNLQRGYFRNPLHLSDQLPITTRASLIKSITSSLQPEPRYGRGYPEILFDNRRAVAGDYGEGWAGFYGQDSLFIDIQLLRPSDIRTIILGICHAPNDWVMAPQRIEVQWSRNGKKYSAWQPLSVPSRQGNTRVESNAEISNPNAGTRCERQRYQLHFPSPKRVSNLRLRIYPQPTLPEPHPYAGNKAWLMIDEIELVR